MDHGFWFQFGNGRNKPRIVQKWQLTCNVSLSMQDEYSIESNRHDGDLPESVLFGKSDVMQNLRLKLARVCATSVPVLLQGEMCVGKSVLCRFIHHHSKISAGPYLSVNCSALADHQTDVGLASALTSSIAAASAAGEYDSPTPTGTLLLRQVSELSLKFQLQLSHLLADYDWNHKGDQRQETIRILSTSTRDLRREVKEGRFRRDLFDRLAVVRFEVPPLKRRLADLPEIVEYLRLRYSAQDAAAVDFKPDLLARMMTYSWPGNFCELESFVRRHLALKGDYTTSLHQAPLSPRGAAWDLEGITDRSKLIDVRKLKN